jgi:NADPH-dependent 2,4-dienoyl-CoA reductase/sulfur reductase-like enzyme/peroxiredoxin family protein/rhodanese-related sulfurtransferase/TusA-related sulfurtransferase
MPDKKRIVIVGGVAGGASAAARARRLSEDAEIVIFERGEFVSFANCGMPYHIGGVIPDRSRLLVQTPESLKRRFRIDVRVNTEVLRIDRTGKKVIVRDLKSGAETAEPYDALILSPGAEPVRPPIPGADSPRVFTLRSMRDMDAIKALVDAEHPPIAAVIGAGYIGLEMTEALVERGVKVVLIELMNQVMGPLDPEMAALLNQQLTLRGVDLRLGTSVTSIREEGGGLAVVLSTGDTVACGFAMMTVGVRPDVKLARDAGLTLGETGGIRVDEHMRTSDPDIYAVGDAVEVKDFVGGFSTLIPLAGPANRQGRIAADVILGRDSAYRNTQGTAIVKVFDLAAGMTGLSEKVLKRRGLPFEKIYVHPASHAGYYPGAGPISIKLLFDPSNGRILGAQAVGADGVDKRIDVISVAIRAGMTVQDLQHLELTYAPPYGSAKDPVNYAGFVASNVLAGDMRLCSVEDMLEPSNGRFILDVRTPAEVLGGTIPGAINIPIDDLRRRMNELPRDKEILVTCQVGLRGYQACRILSQNGFRCRNLSGGYKTFSNAVSARRDVEPVSPVEKDLRDDTGECGEVCATPEAVGLEPEITVKPAQSVKIVREIDATGLQCPGPIMRLAAEMNDIAPGGAVSIRVTDPGFATDIPAWCRSTGNELVELTAEHGGFRAVVRKGEAIAAAAAGAVSTKKKTIVVFSSDFDRVMAAFIIANGAVSMGSEVTMFFTFWGLNVLRKDQPVHVRKGFLESMFGWMMPRGARKLTLSKLNMLGMGTDMMKGIMRRKHVPSLEDLIGSARASGVRLVACSMTMDIMGIAREELIDGIEEGGVAMYLSNAETGSVNLFV